jgi:hypothetical protein
LYAQANYQQMGASMDDEQDLEIGAMGAVSKALTPLDDDQRGRVIRWVAERYGVTVAKKSSRSDAPADDRVEEDADGAAASAAEQSRGSDVSEREYEHFADLYDASGAATNPNRMLVAAYWVQFIEGRPQVSTLELNKLLKDLGRGVGDTAHVMDSLTGQKPALLLQLKKSGKSRQARKTFKVTDSGRKYVEQMIRADVS